MQVIKLKKKTSNRMELVTLVLTMYCLLSNVKINRTELQVLSYLVVYGIRKSTKDMIIRSQILTSYNSLENTITRLRKMGLIVRDRDGLPIVRQEIAIQQDKDKPLDKIGLMVQLENL